MVFMVSGGFSMDTGWFFMVSGFLWFQVGFSWFPGKNLRKKLKKGEAIEERKLEKK